jgi:hypothetical protein
MEQDYITKWSKKKWIGFLWVIPFIVALFEGPLIGFFIALAISAFFWIRFKLRSSKRPDGLNVVERIQDDLGVDWVTFEYKQPKKKGLMGGYMFPLFPWFSKVKSKEKFYEATIHEHMHIWFMVYGGMTPVIYLSVYFLYKNYIGLALFIIAWMIINEYLAFTFTHDFAKGKGFDTRTFTAQTLGKYLCLYGSVMTFIVIYQMLDMNVIVFLIAVALTYKILLKVWYIIFKKWGWIKEDVAN